MFKGKKVVNTTSPTDDVSTEPTNAQLESGEWPQLPKVLATTVTVAVPQGIFAQLKQARETYVELSKADMVAINAIMDFTATASSFAENGDMLPETAEHLALAVASKMFKQITVYVMPPRLHGVVNNVIAGVIPTTGGERYFLIDRKDQGVPDVVKLARKEAKRKHQREWWNDSSNVHAVVIGSLVVVAVVTPAILALVFWNALFLLLWLAILFVGFVVWLFS